MMKIYRKNFLSGCTVVEAERLLSQTLATANVPSHEIASQRLIQEVLSITQTECLLSPSRLITYAEKTRILQLLSRLLHREPIQRILEHTEFWGMRFNLSPNTFIPRPDTETLVDVAISAYSHLNFSSLQAPLVFADIGTGSSAVIAAILQEQPSWYGIGTDISYEALNTAHENLVRLKLNHRSKLYLTSFLNNVPFHQFDLIVSNPPYIPSEDIKGLEPEVRIYDPYIAIDGGKDGLEAYKIIIPQAKKNLKANGKLILEIGSGQSHAIQQLLRDSGFTNLALFHDLSNNTRVISASPKSFGRC